MGSDDIRKTMGKNFSAEYPYSKFTSVQFNVNIKKEQTAITKNFFGFWEEIVYAKYDDETLKKLKFNYAKKIMNVAKKFSAKSKYIEVVALNWNGF